MQTATVNANVNDEKKAIKCKEFLEYNFTDSELRDLSKTLARTTQEKTALENEKKTVTSEFAAKINGKITELDTLSIKVSTGREHRFVDCIVTMNTPSVGYKTMVRTDTGDVVWEKPMTAEELQLKLDLDNEQHVGSAMAVHGD